jgi:hypothetical protein
VEEEVELLRLQPACHGTRQPLCLAPIATPPAHPLSAASSSALGPSEVAKRWRRWSPCLRLLGSLVAQRGRRWSRRRHHRSPPTVRSEEERRGRERERRGRERKRERGESNKLRGEVKILMCLRGKREEKKHL